MTKQNTTILVVALICGLLLTSRILSPRLGRADAGPTQTTNPRLGGPGGYFCPPLSPPEGPTITVSTEADLRAQAYNAAPGTTILIQPGLYPMQGFVHVLNNGIALRGASGHRDEVILDFGGMTTGHFGILVDADDVAIADLTIRNAHDHGVSIQGRDRSVLYNLHIQDIGDQLIKVNPAGDGSEDGLLACSRLEYTTAAPNEYTNGISAHNAHRWVVRDNEWYRIRTPGNAPVPSILFWSGSSDTVVERNLLVDCYQGISFGNASHGSGDHTGGIVRNNFIYASMQHDVVIEMVHATGWLVAHNTALLLNPDSLDWGMEARFPDTRGTFANNLTNMRIWHNRDGGRGTVTGNITNAQGNWFVNAGAGDLHLRATATAAIDQAASLPQVTHDYDGDARPIGPAPDVGADECGVAPPPTPSPNTIRVPQDQPTIQGGINAAQDGDLVLVSPGTYNENLTISGKMITLASLYYTTNDISFRDQTIIDGGGGTVINVNASVGPETRIIGFHIRNGDEGIYPYAKLEIAHNRFTGHSDAVDYEQGSGGTCHDNIFENHFDDGIDLDEASEVTIENNIIRNNDDDGIEIRLHQYSGPTLTNIIRNNLITGNGEDGIQLIDYPDVSDRVFHIEYNVMAENDYAGLGLMDNGESDEDFRAASIPETIYVFSNTFVNNNHGISGGDNLVALNNIFLGNGPIALKRVDGNSIASYNLFYNNGTDNQGSNIDAATSLYTDPLLTPDYRLQSGSPAIDVGIAYFVWNETVVLDLKPGDYNGSAPDLGAFEYGSLIPTPIPTTIWRVLLPIVLKLQ